MKFFKKPALKVNKFILFPTLGVLVITVLICGYFLLVRQNIFTGKSQARIYLDGSTLVINFKIDKSDQEAAREFSQNLGVDESWEKGIRLNVNEKSVNFLNSNLPVMVGVKFSPSSVSFRNGLAPTLDSGMSGQDYKVASGSGEMEIVASSNQDFSLALKNPADLIPAASASGALYLSPQLSGLLDLSSRIATMDLKVNSGNVSGDIDLK